jgi:hypothetical protein
MKIFQTSDEEYYVAPTAEEAIAAMMSTMSCASEQELRDEGYLGEGYPIELSDEKMSKYTVEFEGGECDDPEGPYSETLTFQEALIRETPTQAGVFCSSNY